jgi:CheY-like chemotaxis protein
MITPAELFAARVLIVDDREPNVLLLEAMLRRAGYTSVARTTNPQEVCDLHREHRFDLILLDLQMPLMDGFQVMEALKAVVGDAHLPVLVITAQPGHKLRGPEGRRARLHHQALRAGRGADARAEPPRGAAAAEGPGDLRRAAGGAQPVHSQGLRALPLRRDRRVAAGLARGAGARRRAGAWSP